MRRPHILGQPRERAAGKVGVCRAQSLRCAAARLRIPRGLLERSVASRALAAALLGFTTGSQTRLYRASGDGSIRKPAQTRGTRSDAAGAGPELRVAMRQRAVARHLFLSEAASDR